MRDRKEYARLWHLRNRERRLRANRRRYRLNRAKYLADAKKWQQENRDKCSVIQKRYRSKPGFKEFNRKRMAKWRKANPEKDRIIYTRYYWNHRAEMLARHKHWYNSKRRSLAL